ncbi:MAG: extracellular solute-binding protein [Verrucomicrobiota bacterium]
MVRSASMIRLQLLPGLMLAAWLVAGGARAGWIEDAEDRTVIHVSLFALPDPSRTDTPARADVAAVKEFKRRFPDTFAARYARKYREHPEVYGRHNWDRVEVQLHRFSGITIQNLAMDARPLMAIAGGVSPDVLYVNFRQSDTYIQQGFLYPLDRPEDGYLADMSPEEIGLRIHERIWPVIRRTGPAGGEHVWALPYGGALGKVVLYRKDLFDAAGVPYPTNHWTWADFLDTCKRIADPGRGTYGLALSRSLHESWYWINFLWSAGGEVLAYDAPKDEWRAVFDSPEAAVALDFYTRLTTEPWTDAQGKKRYGYAIKATDNEVRWQRGEIGMIFDYIDEKLFSKINPDLTGMAPVPIGPTGLRAAELNSFMMGLFAGIGEPAVRDAAWEYMRFYDSEDALRIKTRVMVEGGLGRFVNPRYLNRFGYPELVRLAPPGWKECFEIAMATGRPEPYGRNCQLVYNLMTRPIQAAEELAIAGKLPADPARRLAVLQGLLQAAVRETNEKMIGVLTPAQRLARRATAAAALACIVAAFALALRKIARTFTPPEPAGEVRAGWGLRKYAAAYLVLVPALLTILCWQYLPVLQGSAMAFLDYRIMGGSRLVWLDNFGEVLWDKEWWLSVLNSLRYTVLVLALTFIPPVILAILLQEIPRGKVLFRTVFYLPAVITGLVVILLWKSFYDPTELGVLNAVVLRMPAAGFLAVGLVLFLVAFSFFRRLWYHRMVLGAFLFLAAGAAALYTCIAIVRPVLANAEVPWPARLLMSLPEPFRWLQSSETAMLCCVLPLIWAGIGPGSLIYLAALKGIPDDLYEAADMDGATFVDKVLFVIFPMLKVLLIINFVGVFIHSWLHAGGNILAMTGGASGTEVADLHIFYRAFMFLKFGPATAMAWILGVMLIGFTIYQLRILSRIEFRAAGEKKKTR